MSLDVADYVEKVLCGEHANVFKGTDALNLAGHGGPRRPSQDRSAILLAEGEGFSCRSSLLADFSEIRFKPGDHRSNSWWRD